MDPTPSDCRTLPRDPAAGQEALSDEESPLRRRARRIPGVHSVARAGALLINDCGGCVPWPLPAGVEPPEFIDVPSGSRRVPSERYVRANVLGLVGEPKPDGSGRLTTCFIYVLHEVGS